MAEGAASEVAAVVERYHEAAGEFIKGDPEPYKAMFSHGEIVSLANPFGPPVRGWHDVAATMERAAALYTDGEITGFENIATQVTAELAYIVEIERFTVKVAGKQAAPVALRTTSVLRPEEGTWKVVHRHADPITTPQAPASVVQT